MKSCTSLSSRRGTSPQPAAYLGRRALELLDRGNADWEPMEGLVVAERRRELALRVV